MPTIDLENQVLNKSSTDLYYKCNLIVLDQYHTYSICHALDSCVIIHPPRMTIPLLQVLLGFSIAIQRPLGTLYGGEVRMDIRTKERGDGGRSVPTAGRMTTGMFLDADGMIAKDGMKLGGLIAVFLERVPTGGADMGSKVKQARLLR